MPGPPACPFPAHSGAVQLKPAPGPPQLAHQGTRGTPGIAQRFGGNDSFEIDPVQIGLARGGGLKLPEAVLARMEAAFSADFSAVRVHVGPQASRIGAIAFTTGNDLYFAPGRYQPESIQGQQLIGHELAHVVQQRQGRVRAPASGVAVVQDRALEAEADRLGMRAAAHRLPVQRKAASSPAPAHKPWRAVQRYKILGQNKIYAAMPASRPWFGYPYAVVPGDSRFAAQQRAGGDVGVNEFLVPGQANTAHVRRQSQDVLTLRVSDDNRMAIENSNLDDRQPKTFFATAGVIAAANVAAPAGSSVALSQQGRTITILTGWGTQETLHRVVPQFNRPPPQNCNELARQITATFNPVMAGGRVMEQGVARFLDEDPNPPRHLPAFDMNAHAGDYVWWQRWDPERLRRIELNAAARPDIGHAFMIGTIGPQLPGAAAGGVRVRDIASNQVRTLNWSFHFGAVVARSGSDRITLENYARGDGRGANVDPRWYFQMYGEASGQSFHEFHEARNEYANPVTVSTAPRVIGPQGPLDDGFRGFF